jgi:hypothetical protein
MSKIKEVRHLEFNCHLPPANRSISACFNIGCSIISGLSLASEEACWHGLCPKSQPEATRYVGRTSDSYKHMPDVPLYHQKLKRKGPVLPILITR